MHYVVREDDTKRKVIIKHGQTKWCASDQCRQANIVVVNSYSELILALNPAIFPCCCSCCCCCCCCYLCSPQFACPSKKRTNFACMSVEYIVCYSIFATGTAPRNKLNQKLCHMLNKQPIHVYIQSTNSDLD